MESSPYLSIGSMMVEGGKGVVRQTLVKQAVDAGHVLLLLSIQAIRANAFVLKGHTGASFRRIGYTIQVMT